MNRRKGSVLGVRWGLLDLAHDIEPGGDAGENRMLRLPRGKPVEIAIVHRVDEKLAAPAVRSARVRHRQGTGLVRQLGVSGVLVLNAPVRPVPSTRPAALRIPAIGAAELNHETIDHAVEMQPIIETGLGQLDEVASSDRHLVNEQLGREIPERCVKNSSRIRHDAER